MISILLSSQQRRTETVEVSATDKKKREDREIQHKATDNNTIKMVADDKRQNWQQTKD